MENLEPDKKTSTVMVYTMNMLIRGEVVTGENMRVEIWPRLPSIPNFIHIINPSILLFGGSPVKPISCAEIIVPTATMIGFHLAPPAIAPLDYDENEKNRSMEPISLILGTFMVKGHIHIATSSPIEKNLDIVYNSWLSIYQAKITNPFLPQMQPLPVPMLLVSANRISFLVETDSSSPADAVQGS